MPNVDDVIAEKIAAARARAEATKRRRAALQAARQHGIGKRNAARLRHQADAMSPIGDTDEATPEPEPTEGTMP